MQLFGSYSESYFDEYYRGYKQRSRSFFSDRAVRALSVTLKPRSVLDIGCGMGYYVQGFLNFGVDACPINIREYAIGKGLQEQAKRLTVFDANHGLLPSFKPPD